MRRDKIYIETLLLLETSDLAGAVDIGGGAKMSCCWGLIELTKLTDDQEKAKCWLSRL